MDMKAIIRFGLIALAALAMSSCAKETVVDQVNPDTPIEFGTYLGRAAQTKGSVAKLDAATVGLQTTGFGVYAFYTEDKEYATFQTTPTAPNFMVNQKVTWGTAWTYTPVKYWPNETAHKVSFFAYAPYYQPTTPAPTENITAVSAKTATGNPTLTFAVASDVTNQKDLLFATNPNLTKPAVTAPTIFTFKHALARIGFKANVLVDVINEDEDGQDDDNAEGNGTLASETKVTVNSIKLTGNFHTNGTLDLTDGTWASTASAEKVDYVLAASDLTDAKTLDDTVISELLNEESEYMMIIPADAIPISVTVDYDVTTIDGALNTGSSIINNVITSDTFNFDFKQGKAYTFVLHLGLKSVELTVEEVTAWDDQTNDSVNVPKLS